VPSEHRAPTTKLGTPNSQRRAPSAERRASFDRGEMPCPGGPPTAAPQPSEPEPLEPVESSIFVAVPEEEEEEAAGAATTAAASSAAALPLTETFRPVQSAHPEFQLDYQQHLGQPENLPPLRMLMERLDTSRKGFVNAADIDHAIDAASHAIRSSNEQEIHYRHLPEPIVKILETWDLNQNGSVSIEELKAAAQAWRRQKQEATRQWRLIVALLFICGLGFVGMFVASWTAVEMSKEVTIHDHVLTARDGSPALIATLDLTVENGVLVPRAAAEEAASRRLSECSSTGADANETCAPTAAVATRLAEVERRLSSTIPDHVLRNLDKINFQLADGVSTFTFRVEGFTRVLAPSLCGSLVHFNVHDGMITLDDSNVYFDESLSMRFARLGLSLSEMTMHGRRLQETTVTYGLFSFFEEYNWNCTTVSQPRSPSKPYTMKTVVRRPCATEQMCQSSLLSSQAKPGYDEETNSILVEQTKVETEEFSMSIERYPNHPLQYRVTITDHVQKTHRRFQVFNSSAHFCSNRSYEDAVGNATDTLSKYFPAYLGLHDIEGTTVAFPWGPVQIPARQIRRFRLQPNEGEAVLPLPVDYEDDAATLLPTGLLFYGARDLPLDVEAIMVEYIREGEASGAADLRQTFDLWCSDVDAIVNLPVMMSPFTEEQTHIEFYTQELWKQEDGDDEGWLAAFAGELTEGLGSYWGRTLQAEDDDNLGRRLLSPRRLSQSNRHSRRLIDSLSIALPPDGDASIDLEWSTDNGGCYTLGGSVSSAASPWSLSGALSAGKGCPKPSALSAGKVIATSSVRGQLQLAYGWSIKKEKKISALFWSAKVKMECDLEIYGYISGTTGLFEYKCGRRLEEAPYPELANASAGSGTDAAELDPDSSSAALEEDALTDDLESESASERRLLGRRRRRRRRRRTCTQAGFILGAGVGVAGGCEVSVNGKGIGVSLEGGLDVEIGPFPQPPLDARASAEISAKGCIKIGPFTGCIGLPSVELFDVDI